MRHRRKLHYAVTSLGVSRTSLRSNFTLFAFRIPNSALNRHRSPCSQAELTPFPRTDVRGRKGGLIFSSEARKNGGFQNPPFRPLSVRPQSSLPYKGCKQLASLARYTPIGVRYAPTVRDIFALANAIYARPSHSIYCLSAMRYVRYADEDKDRIPPPWSGCDCG